ncbi:SDR family oxidoreductase [Alphaproteobacteria bacterium]|nr:SDR family oxidoreductase [Alphaproteobacteria bacterium]
MNYKILIFGATGMLGHVAYNNLAKYDKNFKILGIIRDKKDKKLFNENKTNKIKIFNDFKNYEKIKNLLHTYKPNIILNALGLIKQKKSPDEADFFYLNTVFPKILEHISKDKYKIINISTDCVFDGISGNFKENSKNLSTDIYGLSKYFGEIQFFNNLTLRTSIIGHEIKNHLSLLDWFLYNNNKKIYGFKNAYFTGLTTNELVRIIFEIIDKHPSLKGVYHVSSKKISKFDLLKKIKKIYNTDKNIIAKYNPKINRSLDSSKFKKITGIKINSWDQMIKKMKNDNN